MRPVPDLIGKQRCGFTRTGPRMDARFSRPVQTALEAIEGAERCDAPRIQLPRSLLREWGKPQARFRERVSPRSAPHSAIIKLQDRASEMFGPGVSSRASDLHSSRYARPVSRFAPSKKRTGGGPY